MPKNNKEDQEAITFANWLRVKWYRFTHIANESGLPPKVAMLSAIKKKRMWLSPWVPDFIIVLKRWTLLFLELKRTLEPTDYRKDWKLKSSAPWPSEQQLEWLSTLGNLDNVEAILAYWLKEACELVEHYEKI